MTLVWLATFADRDVQFSFDWLFNLMLAKLFRPARIYVAVCEGYRDFLMETL